MSSGFFNKNGPQFLAILPRTLNLLALLMTLRLNGLSLTYTQAELIALGLGTADGTLGYEEILTWITGHLDTKNPAG